MMASTIRSIDITPAERKRRARERLITLTRLMDSAVDVPVCARRSVLTRCLGLSRSQAICCRRPSVLPDCTARELGASRGCRER